MKAAAIATPNIAIIKYWGKRDDNLKLPINSSISVSLDNTFSSRTTVEFSEHFDSDSMTIDGSAANEKEMKNIRLVLDYLRKKAETEAKARIESNNSFPKGAGIASSSSGYSALAAAAAEALCLKLQASELSIAARLGSGSACRSVIGGFAEWKKGERSDGLDSFAVQIADNNHWSGFRVITAVVSDEPKIIGSTEGMKRTVQTSPLYLQRQRILPDVIEKTRKAILEKDHEVLFRIAMAESNSLHAVMLDSWPPIMYLNDVSKKIIARVHELNESFGRLIAAYTFDAGPNAHIFTLEQHSREVADSLKEIEGISGTHTSKVGNSPAIEKLN